MQIRKEAMTKIIIERSFRRATASRGKMLRIEKPSFVLPRGGVEGRVRQYNPIAREDRLASFMGIDVASSRIDPISSPATIQPRDPRTRIEPNSAFVSCI